MATAGDKITATSYNNIRNTFINYLTTGTGSIGYGQTANSSAVTSGQKVTATSWANLRLDISRMANHQGTTVTLPTITSGTKITATQATQLETAATAVIQAGVIYNVAVGQYSDELLVPLADSQRTTAWNATIRNFFTVTFATANDARYFFNSGSTIRFTPDYVKDVANSLNDDWTTLINTIGTVVFNHTSTAANGASPGTGSSIGFYDLTNVAQQIYTKTGSTYATNDFTINAYCNVASNTTGTANIIYFECYYRDDKGPNPNFDENVTGTVTNNVRMFRSSGSNVAVTAPTVAVTVRLDAAQV
jgi:hypothetical protein